MKAMPAMMLGLALLGVTVASYDSLMITLGLPLWCPPPIAGCNEVAASPYAILLGLPIGYFGVAYYTMMAGLAGLLARDPEARGPARAAAAAALLGVCFSAYFAYLQVAYIRAFCIYCLISALTTVALAVITVRHLVELQRAQQAASSPEIKGDDPLWRPRRR